MANEDVVNLVVAAAADMFQYMLPIIGVLAGITFMVSWLMYLTVGLGNRVFRG